MSWFFFSCSRRGPLSEPAALVEAAGCSPRARAVGWLGPLTFHSATAHSTQPTGPAVRLRLREGEGCRARRSSDLRSVLRSRACTSPSAPRRSARPLAGKPPHQPGPTTLTAPPCATLSSCYAEHAGQPAQCLLQSITRSPSSCLSLLQAARTDRSVCPCPAAG